MEARTLDALGFTSPEFGPLWTEIPNYDRLTFRPILVPRPEPVKQPVKKTVQENITTISKSYRDKRSASSQSSLTQQMEHLKIGVPKEQGQKDEKHYSWPHCCDPESAKRIISKEDLRGSLEKEKEEVIVLTPRDRHEQLDEEIQMLDMSMMRMRIPLDSGPRCPAPSPKHMLQGGTTTPLSDVDDSQELYQDKEKEKETEDDEDLSSRRAPPPRPEGLPPLNLDVLKSKVREEAPVCSPRLLSPRVQKPSIVSPVASGRPGPDHSKSVPSLQSPRSAFAQKESGGK